MTVGLVERPLTRIASSMRSDLSLQTRGEVKGVRGADFTFSLQAYCGWIIVGESRSDSLSASSAPLVVSTVV
jgi:hypothetical protein